jgi:hypothetical protein
MRPVLRISIALLLLFAGCQSPPARDYVSTGVVQGQIYRGEYKSALNRIDRLLRGRLHNHDRAFLELSKAICLEAQGNFDEADTWYAFIPDQFPDTEYADAARRRLQRQDGDQKEHVILDLPEGDWKLIDRRWTRHSFQIQYQWRLHLSRPLFRGGSEDREDAYATFDGAIARYVANAKLDHVTSQTLERTPTEALLLLTGRVPSLAADACCLARIFMGPARVHSVEYLKLGSSFTEQEKLEWTQRLRSVRLETAPPAKTPSL